LNYGSFALSATLLGSREFKKLDAIWVYNSPATIGLPLLVHSGRNRTPFLLHVQDLWPESVLRSGMLPTALSGSMLESMLRRLVAQIDHRAAAIAVVSPSVKQLLVERGVSPEKISYVPNPTDETVFYPRPRRPELRRHLGAETGFILMYAGSLGHVQALDTAVRAMERLRHRLDIKLVFVGSGIAEKGLRELVRRLELTSVTFLGRVSQEDIPDLMAAADAQLVSLGDDPFLRASTPSKLQAIFAASIPILAVLKGDGAELVTRADSGLVSQPGDPGNLAENIVRLADMDEHSLARMGTNGREYYCRHMSVQRTTDLVEDLLIRMTSKAS
jgi:glycosyltransferase involved in cell wall biosynthesis